MRLPFRGRISQGKADRDNEGGGETKRERSTYQRDFALSATKGRHQRARQSGNNASDVVYPTFLRALARTTIIGWIIGRIWLWEVRSPRPRPGNLHSDCVWRVIERNDEGAPWISGLVATPPFPAHCSIVIFRAPFPTSERKSESILLQFSYFAEFSTAYRRPVISRSSILSSWERKGLVRFLVFWWYTFLDKNPRFLILSKILS